MIDDIIKTYSQAASWNKRRKANPPATYTEALTALGDATDIINEQDKLIATLVYEANSDPLTNLLNRRGMEHAAQLENSRIAKNQSKGGIAIAIDMIGLKRINDALAHDGGDAAIRVFGHVLKSSLRQTDWVARLGGDEFVVFMRDCTLQEATPRIEYLNRSIRKMGFNYNNITNFIGARMGIAEYNKNTTVEYALQLADKRQSFVHKHLTPDTLKRDFKPS